MKNKSAFFWNVVDPQITQPEDSFHLHFLFIDQVNVHYYNSTNIME